MTPDAPTLIHLTEALATTSSLIAALELWRGRAFLQDRGAISWRLHRLRSPRLTRILVRVGVDPLLRYPRILGLLWGKILAAMLVLGFVAAGRSPLLPLLILVGSNALFCLRNPAANDGADQLAQLVLVACTLAEIVHTPTAYIFCLLFLAAQSALAYATSGWLKAPHGGWWNGRFLLEILSTSLAGDRALWHFMTRHRTLARITGGLVVVADCTLGFAAVFPPSVCLMLLGLGLLLHLGIARVMGLNTFVWAFASTYPAVWFACCLLHRRVAW